MQLICYSLIQEASVSNHRWSEHEPDKPAIEGSVKPTQDMHAHIRRASETCSHMAGHIDTIGDIYLLTMNLTCAAWESWEKVDG